MNDMVRKPYRRFVFKTQTVLAQETLLSRAIRECRELKNKAASTLQHLPAHIAERYCVSRKHGRMWCRLLMKLSSQTQAYICSSPAQVALLRASNRELGEEIHRHVSWI